MKTFTLEISVTEKCNLGCPYCYVANKNTFMSKETFDEGMIKLKKLMRLSGTTEYFVSFFGGEPLLNWELIKHATPVLKADPECKGFNIITNLTMIDEEKHKFIKENNVGVSWSFDGMSSNETRPLLPMLENKNKETGKTFNGILEMYETKKDLILDITNGCKVMIWPGNVSSMSENFDFLLEYGIMHPDFSLVRDDVWTVDDLKNFRTELIRLTDNYIGKIKTGTFCSVGFLKLAILDTLYGLVKGKRNIGCFAGTHGAVLMSSGDFYPCARFASKKLLKMDESFDFKYYQNHFSPKNFDKCKSCDLRQVCNAGCTYSQVQNSNKPLDSVCELYHILYEQAFRLLDECKDEKPFQELLKFWLENVG